MHPFSYVFLYFCKNKREERRNMSKNIFKGLGIALVTPFTKTGEVDYKSLENIVEYQISNKVDFICVLGTTAETPCLTNAEKLQIRKRVVEINKGRAPLLLGYGHNCTAALVEQLQSDTLTGMDGILTVCPYYNKPSQEGLYQHYKIIASKSPVPVVVYNVPGRTGVNMQADTLLRLVQDQKNIVAVKEASGNITQISDILKDKPNDFDLLSGDDGLAYELIGLGASGVISVVGNAYPKEFGELIHLQQEGNSAKALPIQRKFNDLFKYLFIDGNPSGIKYVLSRKGLLENYLRLPLTPIRKETEGKIEKWLATFK